jgi:hypothetical protein
MLWDMRAIGSFFISIAFLVPPLLIVWYLFSWLGRIGRVVEDIALTLHRKAPAGPRHTTNAECFLTFGGVFSRFAGVSMLD